MANTTSLEKKIKAIHKDEMIIIPPDQIAKMLPVVNAMGPRLSREYQQGNLIITRTA